MPTKSSRQRPTATKRPSSRSPKNLSTSAMGDEDSDDMKHSDLHELFLAELADTLNAEQQLIKALPKLIKAAESPELSEALEEHLAETEEHVVRLQSVFESLSEKPRKERCEGMEGILTEGNQMVSEQKKTAALDATIIASGQKVEHYEIASYGTLLAWAKQMGHAEAADLLEQTLEEEKAADQKLTEIALALANDAAHSENA